MQARPVLPLPAVSVDTGNSVIPEHAGDPNEALKAALADLAQAEMARDDAGEVVDRALQRLARAEADVAEHEGLEAKIDAWHIAETRSGRVADMPYTLIAAARERSASVDRLEHASRTHRALAAELRDAEHKVQAARRAASIWAQRVVLEHAEKRAEALEQLMETADDVRAELEALAGCAFPNAGGLCQVTPSILAALNRPSRERGQHTALVLQPHKDHWQAMHAKLLHE
jgi:hypothetical protein